LKNNTPIRAMYPMHTIFWLDDFWISVQKMDSQKFCDKIWLHSPMKLITKLQLKNWRISPRDVN